LLTDAQFPQLLLTAQDNPAATSDAYRYDPRISLRGPVGEANLAVMRRVVAVRSEPMTMTAFQLDEVELTPLLTDAQFPQLLLTAQDNPAATSDAYHITKPTPNHAQAARAMRQALKDAKLNPEQIDYINAHGTSTPVGDTEEAKAVADTFGAHALEKKLWVSSTKSMMGHLLGAAGAVEAAVCIKAIETGVIPPTINLEDPDTEVPLDFVPNKARERRIKRAMSNSFGFGGTNATLVFSAFEG
jgi:acyl transferase domain-containing protein